MADESDVDLGRAVGVTSVQAWRGTFAGEPEADGTPFTFDAVVIEFGIDVGAIPPLFVPVEAIPGLADVLLEAANGPNATTTLQGIDGDGEGAVAVDEDDGEHLADDPVPLGDDPTDRPHLAAVPDAVGDALGDADADGTETDADGTEAVGGEEWARLLGQPRLAVADLERAGVPGRPGVYAWFRGEQPVHLGRATGKRGLRARIGGDHLLSDADLSRSPFRRAVAEHLGVVVEHVEDRSLVGPDGVAAIDAWTAGCTVAWLACATPDLALDLEAALAAEHRPVFPPPS